MGWSAVVLAEPQLSCSCLNHPRLHHILYYVKVDLLRHVQDFAKEFGRHDVPFAGDHLESGRKLGRIYLLGVRDSLPVSLAVFFDIEAAYDTTWRHGILLKVRECGIRGAMGHFLAY